MAWGEDYCGRVFFKLCNCARLHSHARVCEIVLHMSRHRMRASVYALCRSDCALHNFHLLRVSVDSVRRRRRPRGTRRCARRPRARGGGLGRARASCGEWNDLLISSPSYRRAAAAVLSRRGALGRSRGSRSTAARVRRPLNASDPSRVAPKSSLAEQLQSRNNSTRKLLARKTRRRPLPLRGSRSYSRVTQTLVAKPLTPSARASLFVETRPAASVLQAASLRGPGVKFFGRLAAV